MVFVLALASAACYAVAMVLQHHGATAVGGDLSLRPALITRLGRRGDWWAGIGANGAGYVLRLAALAVGSLIVVQALMASTLLFALPASARWHGQRLDRAAWSGVVAVGIGLVWFVRLAGSDSGGSAAGGRAWALAGVAAVVVVWACIGLGARWPRQRSVLLAAAGGTLVAGTAALMKLTMDRAGDGLVRLVDDWPPFALVVATGATILLVQSAFSSGPLTGSLPALMATEVVASVAVGMGLFGEHVAGGPIAASAALATMTGGVVIAAGAAARLAAPPSAGTSGPDATLARPRRS